MRQQWGAIFDCFPFFKGLFKNASHGERQRESGVGACHDREGGSQIQSCTLHLHKLSLGWSSVHFIHVEHANDMNDLFNSGAQESIHWSSVCKFVYIPLILLCEKCHTYLQTATMICIVPLVHDAAWCVKRLQFMYRFLCSCTFCPLKVHICSLPAHLNFKLSVKKNLR